MSQHRAVAARRSTAAARLPESAECPEVLPGLEVCEVEARLRHLVKTLSSALPSMWPGAMIDLWQAAECGPGGGSGRTTRLRGSASGVAGLLAELSRWPACGCGMLAIECFQAAVVWLATEASAAAAGSCPAVGREPLPV